MSVVTHLSSLTAISGYFSNILLGTCRIIAILVVFAFSGVIFAQRNNSHFPTGVPNYSPKDPSQPPAFALNAACFTSNVTVINQIDQTYEAATIAFKNKGRITGLAQYVILFVFTIVSLGMAIAHSFFGASSWVKKRPHTARKVDGILRLTLIFIAIGIAIAACVQFNGLRRWMHASVWPADDDENEWSFGQLVPCFLMILAPLQVFEALTEFWQGKKDKKAPLSDHEDPPEDGTFVAETQIITK
ncbi:hypothetical protein ACLMJK_006480 [Lecanora helva]